jgi:excisionase family DNA binding protein
MSTDNLELLTIQEVADILKLKPTFVMEHVEKKAPIIPSVRINRRIRRFRKSDIAAFIELYCVNGPEATTPPKRAK